MKVQSPNGPAPRRLFALILLTMLTLLGAPPQRAAAADADCAGPNRLIVQIDGMRSEGGDITVTLYPDDEKKFLAKTGKMARVRPRTVMPVTEACFTLPAPGVYAVAVYHDEDGDHDFGRNLLGLPMEGFGFSNDAPTPIGLPQFSKVRFRAGPGDTTIKVRLRYVSRVAKR